MWAEYTLLLYLSLDCCWHAQGQPPPVFSLKGHTALAKSDLQMAATCAGFGGAQERPISDPRPAAASARSGAINKRYELAEV